MVSDVSSAADDKRSCFVIIGSEDFLDVHQPCPGAGRTWSVRSLLRCALVWPEFWTSGDGSIGTEAGKSPG